LHSVAFPILAANAELCAAKGKTAAKTGLQTVSHEIFPRDYQGTARRILGTERALLVAGVAPGSPAAQAGFKEGDLLLSAGRITVSEANNALSTFTEEINKISAAGIPIAVRIRRNGTEMDLTVVPIATCDYGYSIDQKNDVNAYADGRRIVFHAGMMRFANTDEELATVVGHELAHNLMGHIDSKRGNEALGLLADILFAGFGVNTQGAFANMAGKAYSQEFETEADYVGLYMMARAGFDIRNAASFWRRMGVEYPSSIRTNHASSHPSAPYRFVSLDKTVEEIERKKAAGLPLRPEMKSPAPQ
jgi:Zn-dependent protease with chaperone function